MVDFETRVSRLERANRILVVALLGVVVAVSGAAVVAQQQGSSPPVADLIKARKIQVVNAWGQPVVELSSSLHGDPGLHGYVTVADGTRQTEPKGPTMVIISATGDAGEVATYTREGQVLVHVSRLRTVANDYQPVSGSGVVYTFDGTGGSMADCVTDTLGEP